MSVVGVNGENARSLVGTEVGSTYGKLQWSPDGNRLAVLVRYVGQTKAQIDVVDPRKGDRNTIVSRDHLRTFSWLPDGRFIYAVQDARAGGGTALYEMDKGGTERQLNLTSDMSIVDMSVSADGQRLALVRGVEQSDVYFADLSWTNPKAWRRITLDDRDDLPTALDADANVVLFQSLRNGTTDVFRQALDSPTADLIAGGPERQTGAQFAPGGNEILYWSHTEGSPTSALMSVPLGGGTARTLFEVEGEGKIHCSVGVSACVLGVLSKGKLAVMHLDPKTGSRRPSINFAAPEGTTVWNVAGQVPRLAVVSADKIQVHNGTSQSWSVPLHSLPGKVTDLAFVQMTGDLLVTARSSIQSSLLLVSPSRVRSLLMDRRELSSPVPSKDGRMLLLGVKTDSSNVWLVEDI